MDFCQMIDEQKSKLWKLTVSSDGQMTNQLSLTSARPNLLPNLFKISNNSVNFEATDPAQVISESSGPKDYANDWKYYVREEIRIL